MRKIKEIIKRYEIDQLLTCLFISALLIFGALYLIFLVSPNSAYISYEATNVNSIFNITAKEIRGVLATEVFTFCDFDELEFYPTNDASYFVDGIEYTSDDVSYLRVLPEPDVVISDNGEEYIIESEVTYYMKEHTTAYIDFNTFYSHDSDNAPLSTVDYLADEYSITLSQFYGFFTTSDNRGILNHDAELIDPEAYEFIDVPEYCDTIRFEHCNIIMVLNDDTEIKLDPDEFYSSESLCIDPNQIPEAGKVTMRPPNWYGSYSPNYSIIDLKIDNVSGFQCEGSGELVFSYARTPTNYSLINQVLTVQNSENSMNMNIAYFGNHDNTKNNFYVNGRVVKDAVLSENNLFPDLQTWFRENVYLAPLTLITTIYGAFSLKTKGKKEKDEDELEKEVLANLNRLLKQQIFLNARNVNEENTETADTSNSNSQKK